MVTLFVEKAPGASPGIIHAIQGISLSSSQLDGFLTLKLLSSYWFPARFKRTMMTATSFLNLFLYPQFKREHLDLRLSISLSENFVKKVEK